VFHQMNNYALSNNIITAVIDYYHNDFVRDNCSFWFFFSLYNNWFQSQSLPVELTADCMKSKLQLSTLKCCACTTITFVHCFYSANDKSLEQTFSFMYNYYDLTIPTKNKNI